MNRASTAGVYRQLKRPVLSVHLDEVKDTLSLQDSSDRFPQESPPLTIDNSAALFQPVGVFFDLLLKVPDAFLGYFKFLIIVNH